MRIYGNVCDMFQMRFPPSGKGPLRGTPDGVGHKWPVKHEKMKI